MDEIIIDDSFSMDAPDEAPEPNKDTMYTAAPNEPTPVEAEQCE